VAWQRADPLRGVPEISAVEERSVLVEDRDGGLSPDGGDERCRVGAGVGTACPIGGLRQQGLVEVGGQSMFEQPVECDAAQCQADEEDGPADQRQPGAERMDSAHSSTLKR
jgi:hypothetical protein